jgi:hypothetical protein
MLRVTGLLLLAFWLIVEGLLSLTGLHFPYEKIILAVLAFASGLFLLLDMFLSRLGNIGLLLLSIWLLINSTMVLFHYHFPYSQAILACLGIGAGLLLIVRR